MTHAPTVAILGTRYPDFRIEESILRPFGASLVSGDGRSRDAIAEQAAGATVVLAGSGPRFDAGTIDRLTCIGIVRYGVGVETIDVEAAAGAGMWVANVPDYGTHAVVLHCVSLMLAALRRLPQADRIVKSHRWGFAELRPLQFPESLTVGIDVMTRRRTSSAARQSVTRSASTAVRTPPSSAGRPRFPCPLRRASAWPARRPRRAGLPSCRSR